jgi:hypothetical protein
LQEGIQERIFESKREGITGGWRELRIGEIKKGKR